MGILTKLLLSAKSLITEWPSLRNDSASLGSDARSFAQQCFKGFAANDQSLLANIDPILVNLDSPSFFEDSVTKLRETGIVTFPSEISPVILSNSVEEMKGLISAAREGSEGFGAVPWRLKRKTDTYSSVTQSDIPVVSLREGVDAGMVDVFHADAFVDELARAIRELVRTAKVEPMLSEISGEKLRFRNFNIYWNEDVQATRGWHVDSYGGRQYKLFVYLTDVVSLADGPYCYVLHSSQTPGFEEANQKIARMASSHPTDVNLYDSTQARALIAPRGQVVISNQSGAHRGHPQQAGHFRCIAALNFMRNPS